MLQYKEYTLPGTEWAAKDWIHLKETDSTNIQAARAAAAGGGHGMLVTADRQTAGKGRWGRSWESPAVGNLYFTLLLKPDLAPDKASMLTLVMALSVSRAIRGLTGIDCGIKWPNDIVINGRKVCGILTEMHVEKGRIRYVLIGVGINVVLQEFSPTLKEKATSLEQEAGRKVSSKELLSRIMQDFEADYAGFCDCGNLQKLRQEYQDMLINCNAQVRVLDPKGEYEGTALGITETGELLVKTLDGRIEEVYAGEVSVRGIFGYV